MIIKTYAASFLIEENSSKPGCIFVRSNSSEELHRFFGSLVINSEPKDSFNFYVSAAKQEFVNALILMVKEIDYSDFPHKIDSLLDS